MIIGLWLSILACWIFAFLGGENISEYLYTRVSTASFSKFIIFMTAFAAYIFLTFFYYSVAPFFALIVATVAGVCAMFGYMWGNKNAKNTNKNIEKYCHLKKMSISNAQTHHKIDVDIYSIFGGDDE